MPHPGRLCMLARSPTPHEVHCCGAALLCCNTVLRIEDLTRISSPRSPSFFRACALPSVAKLLATKLRTKRFTECVWPARPKNIQFTWMRGEHRTQDRSRSDAAAARSCARTWDVFKSVHRGATGEVREGHDYNSEPYCACNRTRTVLARARTNTDI